jgi:hypothetical protein
MKLKSKFHLTLVVLITFANSVMGYATDTASALDKKFVHVYNQNILLYNKYKLNNIYIKYINNKLYINNNKNKRKVQQFLSFNDKVEILMYSIKLVESSGRYNAKSRWSDACGAYQYMPITWNKYAGFKTACLAPEYIQDAKMRGEVNWAWKKYHSWPKVIATHYLPSYAGNTSKWYTHWFAGQPTISQYVENVYSQMRTIGLSI